MAKTIRYSETEEEHTQAWETAHGYAETDEAAASDELLDASVCAHCGEPLAWHEQACEVAVVVADAPAHPASDFIYELGRPVQPLTQQQAHSVVWRGYLKERHPATGFVQRVPVYRLSDGFWDCYREEELLAA